MAVDFDVGAFGESTGARSRLIPDGATVRASIARVRTTQGILPWVVRVQAGDKVIFDTPLDECRGRWKENTQFIAVMFSVLALVPVVLVFSWSTRRPR